MINYLIETSAPEVKCRGAINPEEQTLSFKKTRKARKKNRLKLKLEKALDGKQEGRCEGGRPPAPIGPTKETAAKLIQDPLIRFRKQNILEDSQILAFQRIRCAVRLITDGTQVRVSCFKDVVVQTSRLSGQNESDFEIRIKEQYTNWIDRMTLARLQAGPVLDIILDEMSLSAVDRKWGKRKGWAKGHLRASLDQYGGFSPAINRVK